MINKLAIPAIAATAFAMGIVTSSAAQAEGSFSVQIGKAGLCIGLPTCVTKPTGTGSRSERRDHRTKTMVRDHRSQTTIRDHRTANQNSRSNELVIVEPRYDCRDGAVKLYKMGYSAIRAVDCDGIRFAYTAVDGSALFHAQMHAYTGKLSVQFVGLTN